MSRLGGRRWQLVHRGLAVPLGCRRIRDIVTVDAQKAGSSNQAAGRHTRAENADSLAERLGRSFQRVRAEGGGR